MKFPLPFIMTSPSEKLQDIQVEFFFLYIRVRYQISDNLFKELKSLTTCTNLLLVVHEIDFRFISSKKIARSNHITELILLKKNQKIHENINDLGMNEPKVIVHVCDELFVLAKRTCPPRNFIIFKPSLYIYKIACVDDLILKKKLIHDNMPRLRVSLELLTQSLTPLL